MTFSDYFDKKEEEKKVQTFLSKRKKQPVFTEHIFLHIWHMRIREFEWEISFGLMKSGVRREMVIIL